MFFQLPVIIFFLSLLSVIDDIVLKKIRPYALVIILVIAAIIAPDVVTQIIIGIPFNMLYEIGILCGFPGRKSKQKNFTEEFHGVYRVILAKRVSNIPA